VVRLSCKILKKFKFLVIFKLGQNFRVLHVGMCDDEPRVQTNASSLGGFTFTSGTNYNPNNCGSSSQFVAMSNLAKQIWFPSLCCTNQASNSSNQATTLDKGGAGGSCVAPKVEGVGSKTKLASDQGGDFLVDQWMTN
jgi:hypothetical protein